MPPLPLSASLCALPISTAGWRLADCVWILPKCRSCGWAPASSWRRSLSKMCHCCWVLTVVTVVDSARNLGVIINSQLSLDAHITAVCRSGYYQLWQLLLKTGSLSADAAKTLLQAFISSRVDYCNTILHGVSDWLMRRLQSVQNAAAWLITGTPRRDHISPILRQLHWLPVCHWVTFKIAVLVFQCLTGQTSAYLADGCQLTSNIGTRRLRSMDTAMCVVRHSNSTFGDHCFASTGPHLWNRLPAHLRQCDSLGQFKWLLMTHLFGSWDHSTLWHLC